MDIPAVSCGGVTEETKAGNGGSAVLHHESVLENQQHLDISFISETVSVNVFTLSFHPVNVTTIKPSFLF